MKTKVAVFVSPKSHNKKTGPIFVTTTSSHSCWRGCAYFEKGCYAIQGLIGAFWRKQSRAGPNREFLIGRTKARNTNWQGLCAQVAALPEGTLWRHNQAGDLPTMRNRG